MPSCGNFDGGKKSYATILIRLITNQQFFDDFDLISSISLNYSFIFLNYIKNFATGKFK